MEEVVEAQEIVLGTTVDVKKSGEGVADQEMAQIHF